MGEEKDNVSHPAHYNVGGIEVIDVIEAYNLGFLDGNIVKYILRYKNKNGIEDLKKCAWYLNRLIQKEEKKGKELI